MPNNSAKFFMLHKSFIFYLSILLVSGVRGDNLNPNTILINPKICCEPDSLNCHPDYSGCLKIDAEDYDCICGSGNGPCYTGRVEVKVIGKDPFRLDRDKDGIGCECNK